MSVRKFTENKHLVVGASEKLLLSSSTIYQTTQTPELAKEKRQCGFCILYWAGQDNVLDIGKNKFVNPWKMSSFCY